MLIVNTFSDYGNQGKKLREFTDDSEAAEVACNGKDIQTVKFLRKLERERKEKDDQLPDVQSSVIEIKLEVFYGGKTDKNETRSKDKNQTNNVNS